MFAMNLKPSFAARFMWMATEGITARSRSTSTNFVSSFPSFAVTMRPATESGRSNHVPMSMPPYFSVDSCTYGPDFFSGLCLILKVGESVCAAAIRKPAGALCGMRKDRSDEPLRVTKYFPPGVSAHASCSRSCA